MPALSRRKPSPALRLFAEPTGDTVVGAHQLSNVRWSAVFDDVELTAADIARLAAEARPLVRSHGRGSSSTGPTSRRRPPRWPSGPTPTQLTGAEILRHAVGLEGTPLGRRASSSRAAAGPPTCSPRPRAVATEPVTTPEGFVGELRSYQAEALGWLGFLDAVELGGCLALDMGLGKTPDRARPPRPHRRATAPRW